MRMYSPGHAPRLRLLLFPGQDQTEEHGGSSARSRKQTLLHGAGDRQKDREAAHREEDTRSPTINAGQLGERTCASGHNGRISWPLMDGTWLFQGPPCFLLELESRWAMTVRTQLEVRPS